MLNYKEAMLRYIEYYDHFANNAMQKRDLKPLLAEKANIHIAIEHCLKIQNYEFLAKFYNSLGRYWLDTGTWDSLFLCLQNLLEQNLHNDIERVDALGMLAEAEETRGHYDKARFYLGEQILILNRLNSKDTDRLAWALKRSASLAELQHDYEEAQSFLECLHNIWQEQCKYKEQVYTLLAMAELHVKKNDFGSAVSVSEDGLKIARGIGFVAGEIDILIYLATIQQSMNMFEPAQASYKSAFQLSKEIGDFTRVNRIALQLKQLEVIMGREVFISYNHHDRNFVIRLANDLSKAGVSVWWDEWEIKVGDSIIQKVSDGIRKSSFLVVVLSPNSVDSPWVQREVGSALMRQLSAERDITILPLLIAGCEIPPLLREVKYADFRRNYKNALAMLLAALT